VLAWSASSTHPVMDHVQRPDWPQTQFLMTTFGILTAFAVGAEAGCAAAAIAMAGWEQHKPRHLPPEAERTTYG
jgi:hypothetical protein